MANSLLEHYIKLTEFLGHTLGPEYEVVLHDLTDKDRSIVAIANRHVSGRQVGAPLSGVALDLLSQEKLMESDYLLNYRGENDAGKALRCSTLFIKQQGKPIGMLCINFDDSRYRAVSEEILRLRHPDAFVDTNFQLDEDRVTDLIGGGMADGAQPPTDEAARVAVARELARLGVSAEQLTPEGRLQLIQSLDTGGIFLLKGAVNDVADALRCSKASIYRYISQAKNEK